MRSPPFLIVFGCCEDVGHSVFNISTTTIEEIHAHRKIGLNAFAIMPNHFHLLLEQIQERAISSFMHGLCLSYSMIFNKRYEKVGRLFQGVYKARLITRESEISTVASYIHINPSEVGATPEDYPYSSYGCYLGKDTCRFLTTELLQR